VKIGLRVCVNTLQGVLQGVPNLLRLFDTYKVRASFFFALGADRCGRFTTAHALQPWCKQRDFVSRLGATLMPPPIIENRAADQMRSVKDAGHEVGLLSFDPVNWVHMAAHADAAWTRGELTKSIEAFDRVFGESPGCHAAAGWQLNSHLLMLEEEFGLEYASDVRGKSIFLPHLQGVVSACPQIATTLPAVTELLSRSSEVTPENVHEYLYAESQYILPHGHVYSLDAEMEGREFLPLMEKLVVMWKGYGEGLTSLGEILEATDASRLKSHQIGWSQEEVPENYLARQSLPL
jgi:undecaprenyl phosphate-alpha-L-ara4FN deformylase